MSVAGWMLVAAITIARSTSNGPTGADTLPAVEPTTHHFLNDLIQADSGNIVLVNVWATWCDPCKEELPHLLGLMKEYPDSLFRLILVSVDEPDVIDTHVRPMLRAFGVDFRSYYVADVRQEEFMEGMHREWRGAIPASFLYGRDGRLAEMIVGERSASFFRERVRRLLGR